MARRTIILSPDETQAVKDILDSPLARRFSMNERDVMRYALLHCKELFDLFTNQQSDIAATKQAIQMLAGKIDDTLDKVVDLAKETRGRPKRLNAKKTPEEEYDAGKLICEELGGIQQGHMCMYKKYEMGPGGRPQRPYEVGVALTTLSETHLDEQYFPSKEVYEAAVAKANGTV